MVFALELEAGYLQTAIENRKCLLPEAGLLFWFTASAVSWQSEDSRSQPSVGLY